MAYRSSGAGYADVAAHFRRLITDGELAPGDSLPSVAEIREQFDVSAKTVSRALKVLKDESLIVSRGSLGTVVAPSPVIVSGTDRLDRLNRTGRKFAAGEDTTGHRVMIDSCSDPAMCRALDIEPGDEVIIRIRTFRQDGKPTTLGVSVIHPRARVSVPEIAEERHIERFWQHIYTERTGREITRGQRTVHARQASQDELDALEIDAPEHLAVAVLVTNVTFHDEEGPIEHWEDVYAPGSRIPMPK